MTALHADLRPPSPPPPEVVPREPADPRILDAPFAELQHIDVVCMLGPPMVHADPWPWAQRVGAF